MGQASSSVNGNSGFVVEIAPPKLVKGWQALPQQDDEEPPPPIKRPPLLPPPMPRSASVESAVPPWRIIVNPQADDVVDANLQLSKLAASHGEQQQGVESASSPTSITGRGESSSGCESDDDRRSAALSPSDNGAPSRPRRVSAASARSTYSSSTTSRHSCVSSSDGDSGLSCGDMKRSASSHQFTAAAWFFPQMNGFSRDQFKRVIHGTTSQLYGVSKVLTEEEAKCLVLSLELRDTSDTLLRTLTTIGNLASFTINQDLLRRFGGVRALLPLMEEQSLSHPCKVMVMQCVANMAANPRNAAILQESLSVIMRKLGSLKSSELEKMVCVQALTNMSVQISAEHVHLFANVIPCLYKRIWSHGKVNIAVLKLLVNLACCSDLVPYLLAAKAPPAIPNLLNPSQSNEVVLRALGFFRCLCASVETLGIDTWDDLRQLTLFAANRPTTLEIQTVFFGLFAPVGAAQVLVRLDALLAHHRSTELCSKADDLRRMLMRIVHLVDEKQEGHSPPPQLTVGATMADAAMSPTSSSSVCYSADEEEEEDASPPSNLVQL